jgi:hypothetical protein
MDVEISYLSCYEHLLEDKKVFDIDFLYGGRDNLIATGIVYHDFFRRSPLWLPYSIVPQQGLYRYRLFHRLQQQLYL